ncbi:MAG: aspartate/glutamate/uridylate kinase [Acetobacteraceae bacterium]
MTRPITVVKLGGSYARSPLLHDWLRAIGRDVGRVVVVPGGGTFADAVREAQSPMGFDDRTAHDMGLLAMAQYGRALVGIGEGFVLADTLAAIEDALTSARVPVWSPWPMLRGHPDIPASWDVTSDSLALWLARAIGAARLVLVKRRAMPPGTPPARLVADGIVDPAFPRFRDAFAGAVEIAGPGDARNHG